MRVGVLGSGEVGQALASGFVSRGHETMIGTRSPEKDELVAWQDAQGELATAGTFAQAAEHGELLVLAVDGSVVDDVLELAGAEGFSGKVLIDVTNPLDFSQGMPPGLLVGTTDSLGEHIQRTLPEAQVVKAFNTVSNTQMVDPSFEDPAPELLICGEDPGAKKTVAGIVHDFGWPGVLDVGGIEAARWLEALVPLWVRLGAELDTWGHGFRVARPTG